MHGLSTYTRAQLSQCPAHSARSRTFHNQLPTNAMLIFQLLLPSFGASHMYAPAFRCTPSLRTPILHAIVHAHDPLSCAGRSSMFGCNNVMGVGRAIANNKAALTGLLYQGQTEPPMPLRVTGCHTFWKMRCTVHVKFCTIEADVKQMADRGCLRCDRCDDTSWSHRRTVPRQATAPSKNHTNMRGYMSGCTMLGLKTFHMRLTCLGRTIRAEPLWRHCNRECQVAKTG